MLPRAFVVKGLFCCLIFCLIIFSQPTYCTGSKLLILDGQAQQQAGSEGTREDAETVVLTINETQVDRLIEALAQPEQAVEVHPGAEKKGGLVSAIERLLGFGDRVMARLRYLQSATGTEPENMPQIYRLISEGEKFKKADGVKTIASVFGVLAAGFIVFLLFRRFITGSHNRFEELPASNWKTKVGGLALRAGWDLLSMGVFSIATLLFFYVFLERTGPQRVLVLTYFAAVLIVMGVHLASRFFLAPKVPVLRFLPLQDSVAVYLHRWFIAIAVVTSFGFATCGLFRLAGAGEGNHLRMVALVEMVIVGMILTMILQKRGSVRKALVKGLDGTGLQIRFAENWHHLAILALLMLYSLSSVSLFLYGIRPGAPGIQTLFIIPLYFLLDWALQQILKALFGIAAKPAAAMGVPGKERIVEEAPAGLDRSPTERERSLSDAADHTSTDDADAPAHNKYMDSRRLNRIIGSGLRIALAMFMFFYLLEAWGMEIQFGKTVVHAVFNILATVLTCYVTWEMISAAIQKKLAEELPDENEELEEGGAGGSRVGTLLLLLRKFLMTTMIVMAVMIILSSIGVNIVPMIAGAGVIGLAIGFGAQTLVKDIISGMFFLVDDAFRVGDYVEAAGTKGMVERISLRSLRLRHPRGMVNTIPFGDIGIVTNMSRDYIISKLDFRVRYDTDVDKVRRIIKNKVYKVILENKDLASKLLGKIKSQGVRQLEDSAMIMRVKYKTIPGEQFVIRKEVYRLMQEAFKEANIEFAHRNVTVFIPNEVDQPGISEGKKQQVISAAGAAAAADIQAREDEEKAKNQTGQ